MTVNFLQFLTGRKARSLSVTAAIISLSAVLAACAGQQQASRGNIGAFDRSAPAGEELSNFLNNASNGSTIVLDESPLGRNVAVIAGESYRSGSGHSCMRLEVQAQTVAPGMQSSIACRMGSGDSGNWVVQRSVIDVVTPSSVGVNAGYNVIGQ